VLTTVPEHITCQMPPTKDQILPIIGYGFFTKPNVDVFAGLAGWLVPVLAPTVPVVRFGACPAPPTTPTPRGIAAGEAASSP
jgi:hypothetical protein